MVAPAGPVAPAGRLAPGDIAPLAVPAGIPVREAHEEMPPALVERGAGPPSDVGGMAGLPQAPALEPGVGCGPISGELDFTGQLFHPFCDCAPESAGMPRPISGMEPDDDARSAVKPGSSG
jgi:hypothetical protein